MWVKKKNNLINRRSEIVTFKGLLNRINKIKKIDFKKKEQIKIFENSDKVKWHWKNMVKFYKMLKKIDLHENMNSRISDDMISLDFDSDMDFDDDSESEDGSIFAISTDYFN